MTSPNSTSLGRWRGQIGLNWRGMALVGDAFSNVVGLSDFVNYTEYGNQMELLITSPPVHSNRHRIFVPKFEVEVQAGDGNSGDTAPAPQMMLDYSKDGGMTFLGLQKWRSMGATGQYTQRLRWLNLGNARQWVFRLRCSDPVRRQLIGFYADTYEGIG